MEFSLWVRVPWWVKGEAVLAVNGQEVRRAPAGAGFVELRRLWSDGDTLRVTFDQPQRAVTPGQSVVLYDGDTVVGGAVIWKGESEP